MTLEELAAKYAHDHFSVNMLLVTFSVLSLAFVFDGLLKMSQRRRDLERFDELEVKLDRGKAVQDIDDERIRRLENEVRRLESKLLGLQTQ
jgi:hypothetical protein